MSLRDAHIGGVPVRVFRISFTGELSYEINIPATYGLWLWEQVMEKGAKYGITPYGTEAMHLLRAEKGFIIVGQETDGTVTPHDLGLSGMVKMKGDFIGRRSLFRPDNMRDDRKRARRPADRRSERRADGRRAGDRQRGGERAAGADARLGHVELFQPEPRPLDRDGAGEGRAQAHGRTALGVAPRRRADPGHGDGHGFPRRRGRRRMADAPLPPLAALPSPADRRARRGALRMDGAAVRRKVHPARRSAGGGGAAPRRARAWPAVRSADQLDRPARPRSCGWGRTNGCW